jgi:hypothetical protein
VGQPFPKPSAWFFSWWCHGSYPICLYVLTAMIYMTSLAIR